MNSAHGFWIVFEGGEGAGKTSQAARLAEAFRARGIHVVQTREPGATVLGSEIRRLLLQQDGDTPGIRTEALLYAADRAHHVEKVVYPALLAGHVVIQDRSIGSTLAYQSGAGNLRYDEVRNLSVWGMNGILPHMTFYLDIDAAEGLDRVLARGGWNRMEAKGVAFHQAARSSFRTQAQASDWYLIDGSLPADEVHDKVLQLALDEARLYGHEPGQQEKP